MFKWFKNTKASVPEKTHESSHRLHVERRQHARIQYPKTGAMGELPFIYLNGQEIVPTNLSLGGLLLNTADSQTFENGKVSEIKFVWSNPMREISQKVKTIRVSQGGIHLRYEDLNPQLLVNLSLALKTGIRGQKTFVADLQQAGDHEVREFWKSNAGDFLMFFSLEDESPKVKIRLPPKDLFFDGTRGLLIGDRLTDGSISFKKTAPQWLLHDLIIFLTNVHQPSTRIKTLMSLLEKLN
jgi:hypothetical protein